MDYYKFILIPFLISATHSFYNASALNAESIHGGKTPPPQTFTYQAGILAKANFSTIWELICGGGIVADNLVMSVAQCFLNEDSSFRQYRFSVFVNKRHWKDPRGIQIDVYLIYFPTIDDIDSNDICLLKLEKNLGIGSNMQLTVLNLPNPGESFHEQEAFVSGYGDDYTREEYYYDDEDVELDQGELKYGVVIITNNSDCYTLDPNDYTSKLLCGRMLVENENIEREICYKDAGDPLVINNKLVGLASKGTSDCVNDYAGATYTNVSDFMEFVNSIIYEEPLGGMITYRNRLHFSTMAATAA